ncbi:Glutathione synthetase [Pleurostoma richardsiae]|uniref:Glutathione synthetase n=1 Tax=Pleurostoma richardsiae TaxID=41990 RepID=A0AA38RYG1_9PEZI|nr:Glutathione synthetase [Pleurostoma richardsiae]
MGSPALTTSTYPPNVDAVERDRLVEVIKDWAISHGLSVRPPPVLVSAEADPEGILATNAPVTLFPSPFPQVCFEQARSVQKAYNELYARISQDEAFLSRVVEEVSGGDDFIANLWKVHLRVKEEGYVQNLCLGLFRSDYMVHQDPTGENTVPQVKQVEFNTIASSFGGLSSRTSELHKFLAENEYPYLKESGSKGKLSLPDNESVKGLADGLKAAFHAYSDSELGLERCIIFLIQGGERNVFDQRHLEYEVQKDSSPRIPVFRLPFAEILQRTSIASTPKRQLLYHHPNNPSKDFEVSVVYFRSGYGPSDYPNESAWEARFHIERSAAIRCPTVLTQLAGAKKVQQVLATPKHTTSPSELGRFIPEGSLAWKGLWATFTNIYPMDESEAGLQARKLALDDEACKSYVLKPQREGGGNNFYRSAIPPYLKNLSESHWKSYILMELITPPPVANIILRNGKLEQGGVICELGIYGACIWDQGTKDIIHNEEAGYLLRTKGNQSEEGGVAAGYGCMDSCCLV